MKVDSVSSQKSQSKKTKSKNELKKEEILKKVRAKFGDKAKPKKAAPKEKVEVSNKGKQKSQVGDDDFGDIGKNNPQSEVTKEKLRAILKTGAFAFNDAERGALNDILN